MNLPDGWLVDRSFCRSVGNRFESAHQTMAIPHVADQFILVLDIYQDIYQTIMDLRAAALSLTESLSRPCRYCRSRTPPQRHRRSAKFRIANKFHERPAWSFYAAD